MLNHRLYPLGETALVVQLGDSINTETHNWVKSLVKYLDQHPFEGMIEYVPAYTTVTVYYDPLYFLSKENESPYTGVARLIEHILSSIEPDAEGTGREMQIPVCYGGTFGPDLEMVAEHNGLTPEEVIRIHTSGEYLVYMIGFAPGFPYIGGMSDKIAMPRRSSPRVAIPVGSVGIAGGQTCIYPIETPGGWQLIGRTPLRLFQPDEASPSLLEAGDQIRFVSISEEEYYAIKEGKG